MYEKSYMHRDALTHCAATSSDFIITGSADGHLKFWKKQEGGIEFVKHYRAHLGAVDGLAASADGALCASISRDGTAKVFDVLTFDMIAMMRLPFVPGTVEWLVRAGDARCRLAISDLNSPAVRVYDPRSGGAVDEPVGAFEAHAAPVTAMRYCAAADIVVSADEKGAHEGWLAGWLAVGEKGEWAAAAAAAFSAWTAGRSLGPQNTHSSHTHLPTHQTPTSTSPSPPTGFIEYWAGSTLKPPPPGAVGFSLKMDTDLFALAAAKTRARSLDVSRDGAHFAAFCADGRVRVWRLRTGKLRRVFDESAEAAHEVQKSGPEALRLEDIDFGRRYALEKELRAAGARGRGGRGCFALIIGLRCG